MKFSYLFLTFILGTSAFTEENNLPVQPVQLEKQHHEIFLPENKKMDEESNLSIIGYGKTIALWPVDFCCSGVQTVAYASGASLRFHKPNTPFGVELDANAYNVNFFDHQYHI